MNIISISLNFNLYNKLNISNLNLSEEDFSHLLYNNVDKNIVSVINNRTI